MDIPSISEFTAHPDYQQVASFFLGAVFITSLNYSFRWIRGIFPRFRHWISRKRSTANDVENNISEKASITGSLNSLSPAENQSFVFALSLCFTFASVAYFASLLSFSQSGGATCAFVVAWGGMAAQTASIIGILMLVLELRGLGIANLEFYVALVTLFVAMIFVFVNNAVGTGALRPLNISICYRKHFLPTALTTSLISIFLEVYVLSRLAVLLTRQATLTSPPRTLRDSRIGKALSLLFLELLTIGPSAVHITLLADFIPVSIGALFVLVAFNCFRSSPIEDVPSLDRTTAPPISVPGIVRRSDWFRSSSGSSQNRDNGEVEAYPSSPPVPGSFPHPFSAQYQGEISRFSTTETTMSHEPVIQTAQRSAPPRTARAIVVTPSDMQSFPTASTQGVTEFTSVTVIPPPSPAVEVQVSSPEPSLAVTPTSLLMHPWHEGPRSMNGAEGYDRKSFTSTIRAADRLSYTYQGFAFPVPPIPSPTNATRRYSSSTLASPMFSQEGDEDGERKKTVKLLTFASTFRSSGGGTGVL